MSRSDRLMLLGAILALALVIASVVVAVSLVQPESPPISPHGGLTLFGGS
jgi:hypothetical protein